MRRVVAHVFVDDLASPVLGDKDVHHLSRVLRLRPGEAVSASDGRGSMRLCQWAGTAALEPIAEARETGTGAGAGTGIVCEPRPSPVLTVAFALTKSEHPEWAVQKLTEAGVDHVVVMTTERCVARWAPASESRHLQRLREVARLAAMQSRRAWLPAVEGVAAFPEIVRAMGDAGVGGVGGVGGVALAVPGGAPLTLATPTVLIGPEGGWSDAELIAVPCHVGLGPHILRAETAAVAAGVLLAALRSGLVAPGAGRHSGDTRSCS